MEGNGAKNDDKNDGKNVIFINVLFRSRFATWLKSDMLCLLILLIMVPNCMDITFKQILTFSIIESM
jgi:hypothetical protein